MTAQAPAVPPTVPEFVDLDSDVTVYAEPLHTIRVCGDHFPTFEIGADQARQLAALLNNAADRLDATR